MIDKAPPSNEQAWKLATSCAGVADDPAETGNTTAAPAATVAEPASGIRPIDQAVLEMLRRDGGLSVPQLTERLQVTATAVRQRLDRLVDLRMIERRKQSVGRGRPSYNYHLTSLGLRYAGVSYADLAMAMWHELTEMPNQRLRQRLLAKVSRRMGSWYRQEVHGDAIEQRLQSVVQLLGDRKIPASVLDSGALPVLEMQACPYPDLISDGRDRSLCEMEQNMLSEAMGQKMELSCCRLDGHSSCQFRPAAELPILAADAEIGPQQDTIK